MSKKGKGQEQGKMPELNAARLQELMQAENQKIIQACMADIEVVLARHRCVLMPVTQIRGQQIVSYVETVRSG